MIPVGCSQRGNLIKYMSVLCMVLFSCKRSCTSDQGSLKYAELLLALLSIKSGNPEISPGGVQNEKIKNLLTLPESRSG